MILRDITRLASIKKDILPAAPKPDLGPAIGAFHRVTAGRVWRFLQAPPSRTPRFPDPCRPPPGRGWQAAPHDGAPPPRVLHSQERDHPVRNRAPAQGVPLS